MGLLDALLSGSQGGGLLDFLRNNAGSQQFGSGLPSDQAQYGQQSMQPPMNALAQMQPNPAMMQQPQQSQPPMMQQPMQQQQPAEAPQQQLPPAFGGGPSFGRLFNPDGLIAKLTGNDTRSIAQQNLKAQYDSIRQALIANGESPQAAASKAMVAAMNPEAAKTIIPELFTTKEKYQKIGVDGLGRETYGFVNERDQTINGKPFSAADAQSGGGLGDMNKSGEEYLATLPKQVQGTVRGILDGTIQPPSSFAAAKPYWQGMIAAAKNADPSFDANNWASRHKMATDIAGSGNSSMGGILSNGKSSFKHLAEYTESAADLGNASHDFPGGAAVSSAQNYIANSPLTASSATRAKIGAINTNLGHFGQESTKFYAATGGGAEERMSALKEMNPTTKSSEEMAAYAEKEKSLMLDRFREKEAQIKAVMGDAYLQQHPVFTPELQKDIARIDANVAKLRGGAAPAAQTVQEGATATNPQTGAKITFRNGKWQ